MSVTAAATCMQIKRLLMTPADSLSQITIGCYAIKMFFNKIKTLQYVFLWFSSPDQFRVTDEA